MKKFLSTTALVCLLSGTAFAYSNTINSHNNNGNTTNNPVANGGVATQGQVGINRSVNDLTNKVSSKNSSKSKSNAQQAQDASSKNKIEIGGDNFEAADIPVNTAYAPIVVATSDCLGSISAGGQGQFLGLTFGKTTQSKPCNVREFAKMNVNNEKLFYTIQCQDPIVREAYKVTGDYNKYCVGAKATVKTRFLGLDSTSAYEEKDVCAYPTDECKRSKK